MKKFYQGALSTPKLHKVQLTETDIEGRWAGDLNATIEQLNTEGCCGSQLWQKCDWEDLWNLKATPKIKIFIRDACCNAIASTLNLGKRHIIEYSSCPRCEEGKETIEHILFFCPPALATWRASTFNHTPSPKDFQSLSDWWLKIKQLLQNSGANTDMSLIAWTCWGIWKAHNEWMLDGRDEDPVNTWNNALKGYHNFMENMLPPKASAIKLI